MHINRGLLFWGLALVTAGIVALAGAQGWIDIPAMVDLWDYWPVILIVIGLAIVLSRTPFAVIGVVAAALVVGSPEVPSSRSARFGTRGEVRGAQDTATGEFTAVTANVSLDMNCGEPDRRHGRWIGLAGSHDHGGRGGRQPGSEPPTSSRCGPPVASVQQRPAGLDRHPGRDVAYNLSLSLNAAEGSMDLSDGQLGTLDVHPNAGSLHMDLSGTAVDEFDAQPTPARSRW